MEDSKGINPGWLWFGFLVLLVGLSFVIGQLVVFLGQKYGLPFWTWGRGMAVSSIIFFLVLLSTMIKAVKIVPQKYVWVIEVLGKFSAEWSAGPHLLFPWGWHTVRAKFFMGKNREIHIPFKYGGDPDLGPLEFRKSGRIAVRIAMLITVHSAKQAAYSAPPGEYLGVIKRLIGRWLRPMIETLGLEEARTKSFDVNFFRDQKPEPYKMLLQDFSLEVCEIGAADFDIPQEIADAMGQVAVAEKRAEAAVFEASAITTLAEASKAALVAKGEGFAAQVAAVSGEGIDPEQVWEGFVKERVVGTAVSGDEGGGNDVTKTVVSTAIGLVEAFKKGRE